MSRIGDLIHVLCPGGVPFRPLGTLGRRNQGVAMTAKRMREINTDGPVRVFAGGNTIADVDETSVPVKSVVRDPSIIVKSRGHIGFTFYEKPFSHKSELWSYTLTDPKVNQKFIYYYLLTRTRKLQEMARATSVKIPQLSVGDTDALRVPVPPLEVQDEIVKTLDSFSALTAELEAELEARRTQYRYYRQRIIDQVSAGAVTLGELGKWRGGMTPSKSNPAFWESGTIPWLASMDVSAERTDDIRGRITEHALEKTPLQLVAAPSVAVVMRSNILRSRLPVGLVKVDTTVNQDMRILVPHAGVDAEYVYQVLRSDSDLMRKRLVRTDGSMAAVDSKGFFNWRVPLPPLDEQQIIASHLNKFDALVNDLTSGLPGEIEARRKQYEYYRNRLLAFEEASA